MRRGPERPGDCVEEGEIPRRNAEPHAARQPDAEHLLPDGGSRPPGARVESQKGADLAEVRREPYEPHHDGDERGHGRAGDAERMAGAPAEDEERREDHVEDDRHGSHYHPRLELPMARRAALIATRPNCRAMAGTNQTRVCVASSAGGAAAAQARAVGGGGARPDTRK